MVLEDPQYGWQTCTLNPQSTWPGFSCPAGYVCTPDVGNPGYGALPIPTTAHGSGRIAPPVPRRALRATRSLRRGLVRRRAGPPPSAVASASHSQQRGEARPRPRLRHALFRGPQRFLTAQRILSAQRILAAA